LGKLR